MGETKSYRPFAGVNGEEVMRRKRFDANLPIVYRECAN
jgi:hypothetical protein